MWQCKTGNRIIININFKSMKKVILSVIVIAAMGLTSFKSETKKEVLTNTEIANKKAMTDISFGVRGNCGMCKRTIEKAAKSIDGVTSAAWDKEKKSLQVSFDDTKTNEMAIQKAVAASGYDTEKVKGDLTAYSGLPGCCKYDHEMEMNQSGDKNDN